MPKQDKNWKRRKIKSGNTDFGWITFSDLTKNEFERKRDKLFAGATRFSHHQAIKPYGKKAYVFSALRKRNTGAKRATLSGIDTLNPGFTPAKMQKAHLIPDTFGGPNDEHNLSGVESTINLSGHKKIENRIGRLMAPVTSPLEHTGAMMVSEKFDHNDVPTQRQYYVFLKPNKYYRASFKRL